MLLSHLTFFFLSIRSRDAFASQCRLSFPSNHRQLTSLDARRDPHHGPNELEESTLEWSPEEAASFVRSHMGNTMVVGEQLKPMVSHWKGIEVGNFLTALYGESFLRPYWYRLEENGEQELAVLLQEMLPDLALTPKEICISAHDFLTTSLLFRPFGDLSVMPDVFASAHKDYCAEIGRVFGSVWKKRNGRWKSDDVISMLTPTRDVNANAEQNNTDFSGFDLYNKGCEAFFKGLSINLALADYTRVVYGLGCGGWEPGRIAHLMSTLFFSN